MWDTQLTISMADGALQANEAREAAGDPEHVAIALRMVELFGAGDVYGAKKDSSAQSSDHLETLNALL
jgi:hypothetical protein